MTGEINAASGRQEKTLLLLAAIGVFFIFALHVSPLWGWSFLIWFGPMMALLALVGFFNASLLMGYRNALIFLAIAASIGYCAEQIGIWTGAIFGPYYYTAKLGSKIIDVPWVIPLCWFAVIYFAHVLTNLIVHAHPVAQDSRVGHAALLAVMTAIIATGLDVALDPAMSHKEVNAWVWIEGGQYMGVPFKNFRGWIATAFVIDLLFRLLAQRVDIKPISQRNRVVALYAIIAWFGLGCGYMAIGLPIATQLVAVFTVILPAFLALVTLYFRAWNPQAKQSSSTVSG